MNQFYVALDTVGLGTVGTDLKNCFVIYPGCTMHRALWAL